MEENLEPIKKKKRPKGIATGDLEKMLKKLNSTAHNKFERLDFTDRESRIIGYRQALKDFAAKFDINIL